MIVDVLVTIKLFPNSSNCDSRRITVRVQLQAPPGGASPVHGENPALQSIDSELSVYVCACVGVWRGFSFCMTLPAARPDCVSETRYE